MADNKKVFQIQINGITQSVDAVKTLKGELQDCEDIIKNLKDAKIDVKVSAGTTKPTEKVSSGKSSDEKVALDIEKEKTKQIEIQNDALREQYVERERLKQANKESLDDIKEEAKGYVEINDGVKTYANTLNGMAAELKDIKKELRNTDIDTDDFDILTKRAAELNEQLREAEAAYGQMGRTVGRYYETVLQALEDWDENREFNLDLNISGAEHSLNDLKAQLREVKQEWANMSPDDAKFEKTAKAIKSLNQQIEDMEANLKDVGAEANSAFTGRFTTTIGGVEASFSNASEACEALRKKLVAMRVAGEENTPMYQEIIQLVRRLSKEVKTAQQDVEGFTKTTRNINKVLGVMKGLSGVASLGQGIAGLFGGASEDLDKFIQKFASLSLVMSGLSQLQTELNANTTAFAKFTNTANDWLNKLPIVKQMGDAIKGFTATRELKDAESALDDIQDRISELVPLLQDVGDQVYNTIQSSTELKDAWDNLSQSEKNAFGRAGSMEDLENISSAMDDFVGKLKDAASADQDFGDTLQTMFGRQQQAKQLVKEQTQAFEEYGEAMNNASNITGKFGNALTGFAAKGGIAAKAVYGLTLALKALMKATVVMVAIQALMWAVEGFMNLLQKTGKLVASWLNSFAPIRTVVGWFDSLKTSVQNFFGVMSESQLKKLTKGIRTLEDALKGLNTKIDIDIQMGNLGEVEAQFARIKVQLEELAELQKRVMGDEMIREWADKLNKVEPDRIKSLNKEYQDTVEYLKVITTLTDDYWDSLKGLTSEELFNKLQNDLGLTEQQLQNAIAVLNGSDDDLDKFIDKLEDIDSDLNDIGRDGFRAFGSIGTSVDNARKLVTQAASTMKKELDNLQKQEWQLRVSLDATDFEARKSLLETEMDELATKFGMIFSGGTASKKDGGEMNEEEKRVAKHLENIRKLQEEAAKKANEDAKKRKKEEDKRKAEDAKRAAKEAQTRARNEANTRIEAMEDGLKKEIALLEQKRKEEIEDAKESGKRVEDINTIYDRKVLEIKKKYAKYVEDAEREHNKRLLDIAKEFASQWVEIQRQIEDERADTAMGKVENKNMSVKQNITFDVSTQGTSEGIDAQKEYYNQMRELQNEYITEKEQLDIEAAQREHQRLIEDENARYQSEKEAYEAEIEEQKRALQEKVDNAQISQEEMDRLITELQDAYHKGEQERLEQHNEKIAAITEHGEEVVTTIQLEANEERQKNNMDAFNNQLDAIQDFYSKIDEVMERTQKRKTNQFGFIDYGEYRKSLKDALDATKQTAEQIEQQKAQLQADLNAKKISFDDFQKAKKQLDEFAEEVKDKTKEMQDNLNQSFNSWMSGIMNTVNQYASVLSGMFDVVNEMYTRELDAQQEALDKKQELLDEELEMLDEQLQKQEEITQGHKDKINSVEDELKSARGDRRQALVDQLAAERKAADESMKKEKQVTEEKKKNQKKQEQLKKEQDALDKKRKKQEQKAAIVQATINMFTAMSNALAVQPWFLGLALMGVAAGLGAANIAQIASQKYADGGLLNGKRHSQGGMKIQGTNMEVEGGEYVTNRTSTNANLPLLEYINSNRRTLTKDDLVKFYDNGKTTLINRPMQTKFEEGGQLPQLSVDVKSLMNNAQAQGDDRPLVVSVVDIVNAAENLQQVRVLSGDTMND